MLHVTRTRRGFNVCVEEDKMFTLGLTNPEIANGKEGGVLLCTQACQASRESCEAAVTSSP